MKSQKLERTFEVEEIFKNYYSPKTFFQSWNTHKILKTATFPNPSSTSTSFFYKYPTEIDKEMGQKLKIVLFKFQLLEGKEI